ncbi:MAG TPA: hypothetical protein VNF72_02705, partial [Myxococcota bacterium]|nr:hypothetical protein [Myxococcota bacterium]
PAGTIELRGRALVAQRTALFERIAPYKRSGNLQRGRGAAQQRIRLAAKARVHLGVQGVHVLEVPEDAADPDAGALRDLLRGGPPHILADELEERLDHTLAAALRTPGAAVGRARPVGRRRSATGARHAPIMA